MHPIIYLKPFSDEINGTTQISNWYGHNGAWLIMPRDGKAIDPTAWENWIKACSALKSICYIIMTEFESGTNGMSARNYLKKVGTTKDSNQK